MLTTVVVVAGSPRGLGGDGKRNWTKNKLERLRRRSPGHNSPATHVKPAPHANMGDETTKRRLVAFIGGLDLCNGRYDTPRHSLFHTLNTVHTQDFYQACIAGADLKKGGEQEVCAEVVTSFEWRKQCLCCRAASSSVS